TFFFSSRRRHTRWPRDWSSDVCSSDLRRRGGAWPRRDLASVSGTSPSERGPHHINWVIAPREVSPHVADEGERAGDAHDRGGRRPASHREGLDGGRGELDAPDGGRDGRAERRRVGRAGGGRRGQG